MIKSVSENDNPNPVDTINIGPILIVSHTEHTTQLPLCDLQIFIF